MEAQNVEAADGLEIREGPSDQTKIIGQLLPGEIVEVLEVNGMWIKHHKGGWTHEMCHDMNFNVVAALSRVPTYNTPRVILIVRFNTYIKREVI